MSQKTSSPADSSTPPGPSTTHDTDRLLNNGSDSSLPFSVPTRAEIEQHLAHLYVLARRHAVAVFTVCLVILLGFSLLLLTAAPVDRVQRPPLLAPLAPGISPEAFEAGLKTCDRIRVDRRVAQMSTERKNPRAVKSAKTVWIRNAVVWDGVGNVHSGFDVVLKDGLVKSVGKDLQRPKGEFLEIDAKGHIVTPGLVDVHSHLGVDSWPFYEGTRDTNEVSDPLTPDVRVLEGFNPSDQAIRIVASGGITTALVLPGSANLMGGEAYAFKLRPVDTLSVEDMLVQAGLEETDETPWRWMKMACGENPKRVYGQYKHTAPTTRMGEGYLVRKRFEEAQSLLQAQSDWCDSAQHITLLNEARRESAGTNTVTNDISLNARFPEDLRNEAVVALLRGDVKLNIHCYETHDIEAMVRHSLEFNFTIAAFHHALDAYRIPAILRRARGNVTVATFADNWGYKKEAFQGSPFGPKILIDAGIDVALKSDHPVLNSQHLIFEAAKSAYYGLTPQQAFSTVSSVPARAMGLGHRIGTLAPGYDADVVVWDRDPLDLGAHPLQVFIDGVPQFEESAIVAIPKKKKIEKIAVKVLREPEGEEEGSFVLRNVGKVFIKKGERVVAEESPEGEMVVRVEGGKVICIGGESCAGEAKGAAYDVQGGYVLPGLIAVGSTLGLVEIMAEPSTTDGFVLASSSTDPRDLVRAVDGLKLGTRHLEEAYKAGVLMAITAPLSESVVAGESVAFKTGSESILDERTLVSSQVALHLQFGDSHKNHVTPTISSQLAFLRRLLQVSSNSTSPDNTYAAAARGDIPVVITTHNADEIASLIRLKRELGGRPDIVILGGAEAHLVAVHLAAARIPVILSPALCTPSTYATQRCLPGLPLSNLTAVHVLHQAGVLVGLGVPDAGIARNLAWDAGLAYQSSQGLITESEAVGLVTYNLEKIFRLDKNQGFKTLSVGADADFVVYSGSPFEMSSRVLMVSGGGKGVRILA